MSRKSHHDSAVRFVTAKSWPEKATKTRQYDLLRPRVGQKEPPRLGSTICYGQTWARKSHYDLLRPSWPEKATKTQQYDLLRPRVGQKKPPRLGSTICYGQTCARKSHQDSAIRFVTAKCGPERATKTVRFVTAKSWQERATETRQYDLLWPNVCQKKPQRLGSTICYGQTWARKGHQDCPEKAAKTRQYDLLRPRAGKKEPLRIGSTICSGQTWARKSHQDSAVRFVTAKRGPERATAVRLVTAEPGPERATETRQYDLLRPNLGQKEPPRLGSTICCGQTWARKSHRDSAVRFVTAKTWPERSAVRVVAAKHGPERATKTRQYDLLRPRVGQKKQPRLGSTICYGQELARKSRRDSAVRCVTAKRGPERATKTRQYDLLRPNVGQKEPPRLGSTICYAKVGPARATETRQSDLLRPRVGQNRPPRLGSTICYGQELARKSHQDSAIRFVTAQRGPERATKTRVWPERATKTRQYDLLRPRIVQKEPPRLGNTICYGKEFGNTICYGQELTRKSRQDSAVRFVTAKRGPERATKTRQYDLLRPRVGQKEPPRLGSTICSGQELARKSHQDSAVRFATAKS